MLGGDHTATLSVVEVLAPAIPGLRVLQLDAHPDLREEFLGERYNYASAMARVMDAVAPERVYQVGMRSGAREEYQGKAPHLFPAHAVHPVEAVRSLVPELARHPLYVTIDVDVLDPSEAPGTGAPEPCGITATELVEIVRLLEPCHIVGTDLMEVAHAFDPSGRTGITASWILREAILTWWAKVNLVGQMTVETPHPMALTRITHGQHGSAMGKVTAETPHPMALTRITHGQHGSAMLRIE